MELIEEEKSFAERIQAQCQKVNQLLIDDKEHELYAVFDRLVAAYMKGEKVWQDTLIDQIQYLRNLQCDSDSKKRQARKMVMELRHVYGLPVVSGPTGYWIPTTQHEANRWLRSYAIEVMARNSTAWQTVMVMSSSLACELKVEQQMWLSMENRHREGLEHLNPHQPE